MTDDLAPETLLADVRRQRARTRRLVDSNWFTFAALGAALLAGALVPAPWGWLAVGLLLLAYLLIALRWRHAARTFAWRQGTVTAAPFALSAAIAAGDVGLSAALDGRAATAAICAWTACGCLVFWRWLGVTACLGLAVVVLAVGVVQLAWRGDGGWLYGVGFLLWGLAEWLRLGRRTA